MATRKSVGLNKEKIVTIENGNRKIAFMNNEAFGSVHRAGDHGIAELYHRANDSTIFVMQYAGFNLEHIRWRHWVKPGPL